VKHPATKPQWTAGRYSLYVDGELVGYFRQFQSAYRWREYLTRTSAAAEICIRHNGSLVNVWRAGGGRVLP
jgi:hypothetical protein